MTSRQTGQTLYAIALVGLSVALVASAVRAQSANFKARRTEIQQRAAADRKQAQLEGEVKRTKLYGLYPTPEIPLAKPVVMSADSTASLSIVGKFSDKTTFVSYNDGVELTNAVVATNSFKATVSAAAGLLPIWGRIYAFAPVSAASAWTPAVFVGSPVTFNLAAANGWIIKLAPQSPAFAITEPGTATITYKADFFKPGATAPFETTTGPLTIEAESSPGSYTFMMSAHNPGSAAAEIEDLTKQVMALANAGKVGSPEFATVQKKMEAAQARWMKEVEAQIKDPASAQKKQDDFGCGTINVSITRGQITGSANCGRNVGSSLTLTGK
jgi:hypothetical protein